MIDSNNISCTCKRSSSVSFVMEGRPLLSGVVADTQLNKGLLFRPIHGGRAA